MEAETPFLPCPRDTAGSGPSPAPLGIAALDAHPKKPQSESAEAVIWESFPIWEVDLMQIN